MPNVSIREIGSWRGAGSDVHLFAVGPWRAPGANTNVFARESQIDVMAATAGVDPVEFRLNNMSDKRMRRVVKAAADAFGWKAAPGAHCTHRIGGTAFPVEYNARGWRDVEGGDGERIDVAVFADPRPGGGSRPVVARPSSSLPSGSDSESNSGSSMPKS